MTPAAFGVITAALEAIDADLTDERLNALDAERLAAAWHATGEICRLADSIHYRLRAALDLMPSPFSAYRGPAA